MNGEITKAMLDGSLVSIKADCFPCRGKVNSIRVSMTRPTWTGMITLNREISVEGTPEQMDKAIIQTVKEMAETIELPQNWKG